MQVLQITNNVFVTVGLSVISVYSVPKMYKELKIRFMKNGCFQFKSHELIKSDAFCTL